MSTSHQIKGLEINAPVTPQYAEILTDEALIFIAGLHRNFNKRRLALLNARIERQKSIDAGNLPDFLPETRSIREGDWVAAPIPADIQDRRVEITGPVDRKMIINALNSGAKVFMADFEDSNSPFWKNNIEGQINLRDAIRRNITYVNETGKEYKLNDKTAVLMVRPRGWHLPEKHIRIDGEYISGSLFDFGLFFFHNAKELIARGTGPYFYLPKLESHLEARLWNDVFLWAQEQLQIPQGTIKATVLIETITATFELHEIIYELRDHIAGLNCGRWDYIFSYIKKLRNLKGYVLPDRSQVTMAVPFMDAYSKLVIQTCHKRRVHAMGGMSAFIPIKNDEAANRAALERVRQDKLREVKNGHDGTWVAHPGLVPVAMEVFNEHMPGPNNYHITREGETYTQKDLLTPCEGTITEAGLRMNINVGILYIESWLRGVGAAAIHNLMEDAATAEISRTQVWQWIKNGSKLDDGRTVTYQLFKEILPSELENIRNYVGDEAFQKPTMKRAIALFDELVQQGDYKEFLTLPAYAEID
ncbi:MAG: malate synthase A [Chitinophagales bacterium]|nr:malate synthase A [Chitinophagales bacterium]MDW8418154.1 malate synthase A [Chitinophagales bacterium]